MGSEAAFSGIRGSSVSGWLTPSQERPKIKTGVVPKPLETWVTYRGVECQRGSPNIEVMPR